MDLDETPNISEGHGAHTQKFCEIAPGVQSIFAKTCFFSATNTMQPFCHLSCTDFDCFWNKTWIGVRMCTPV